MDKLKNTIYGLAIGDACGVPFEFLKRNTFICDNMIKCFNRSVHQVDCGVWSDDTSLTLCILDALQFREKEKIFEKYKENSINWFYNSDFTADEEGLFDIGGSCRLGIIELKTGNKNWAADGIRSNGNGGLMRILPLTFLDFKNDEEIMEYIKLFNACSHNHIISHIGCLIYIKLSKNLLNGMSIEEAIDNLNIDKQYQIKEYERIFSKKILKIDVDKIKSSGYVVDTLEAAIWSLYNSKDFKTAIFTAINLGEDTDTVGAVTGGLAGIIYDIPLDLKVKLKNKELIDATIKKFEER